MTAKLLVREVGQREFSAYNGPFEDTPEVSGIRAVDDNGKVTDDVQCQPPRTAVENAAKEGERLCAEGNVEAFQVWQLVTTKQRVWKLEEVSA